MNDTCFESCIRCTICTTACPVSRINPRYLGPRRTGPDGERLRLKGDVLYDETLKHYINCKRCGVACPSDVRTGDIIQHARAQYGQQKSTLCDAILSHIDLMDTLSIPSVPLVSAMTGLKSVRRLPDTAFKINHRHTLSKCGFDTFRRTYRQPTVRQAQYPEQVTFFHGCYVSYNHPQLGKDLTRVVNTLGTGAQLLSKEKCYGVSLITNGLFDKTRRRTQSNVVAMRKNTLPIITISSTRTFTLRGEYPHLLDVDNNDLCNRVELATRWIWRQLDAGKTLPLRWLPLKVVYHTSCHTERMDWLLHTLGLLRLIPGLQLEVLDSQCYGIMGIYGFKAENYVVSQAIDTPLFRQVEENDANIVVVNCEICKRQIEMSTRKCCKHPLTVLAQALA